MLPILRTPHFRGKVTRYAVISELYTKINSLGS